MENGDRRSAPNFDVDLMSMAVRPREDSPPKRNSQVICLSRQNQECLSCGITVPAEQGSRARELWATSPDRNSSFLRYGNGNIKHYTCTFSSNLSLRTISTCQYPDFDEKQSLQDIHRNSCLLLYMQVL